MLPRYEFREVECPSPRLCRDDFRNANHSLADPLQIHLEVDNLDWRRRKQNGRQHDKKYTIPLACRPELR